MKLKKIKSKVSQTVQEQFNVAVQLAQSGRLPEAEARLRQLLAARPESEDAANLLAMVCCQLGKFDEALALNARSLEKHQGNADFHHNRGIILYSMGRREEAALAFENAVRRNNAHDRAYHYLGMIHNIAGEPEKSLASYRRALEINPRLAEAHYNCGVILVGLGQTDEAIRSFESAVAVNRNYAEAYKRLGDCYSKTAPEASLANYRKALGINPRMEEAHFNCGVLLAQAGRTEEAEKAYGQAIALNDKNIKAYHNLGCLYHAKGLLARAAAMFERVLELDPGQAEAKHMLAVCRGETVAEAPEGYVATLFDRYADNFEKHLTTALEYRTPQLLREEFDAVRPAGSQFDHAMDLGCGTGLCGERFRDIARRLSGIDLSPKILEKAREKNVYDDLQISSISDISGRDERYDLVIAADVFVYLGDLAETFRVVAERTTDDAWFLFSVEATEAETFELRQSGRFAHGHGYIEALAASHGFAVRYARRTPLRKDKDAWIEGEVFIMQKTGTASA